MIHMKFPGDVRGLIHDSHNNRQPQEDWYATFRFEGTEGVIKGTNGALYDYPNGREDTISYYSRRLRPDFLFSPQLEGHWFPHAFMGTMGELMRAVEENREPENSVADNLLTRRWCSLHTAPWRRTGPSIYPRFRVEEESSRLPSH